jgi:hypothetical protein
MKTYSQIMAQVKTVNDAIVAKFQGITALTKVTTGPAGVLAPSDYPSAAVVLTGIEMPDSVRERGPAVAVFDLAVVNKQENELDLLATVGAMLATLEQYTIGGTAMGLEMGETRINYDTVNALKTVIAITTIRVQI